MAISHALVKINTVSRELEESAVFSFSYGTSFSAVAQFKNSNNSFSRIITGEKNVCRCDGSYFFADNQKLNENKYFIPFMSDSVSDSAGKFPLSRLPAIKISLKKAVDLKDFSIIFGEEAAFHFKIEWFFDDKLIAQFSILDNKSRHIKAEKFVEGNFNKVIVTFLGTKNPYMRIKVQEMFLGSDIYLDSDLKSAICVWETDFLSNILPIGKLEFSAVNRDGKFYAFNKNGQYDQLSQGQLVILNGSIVENGILKEKKIGEYYLDKFESSNFPVTKFSAVDIIGAFDKIKFVHQSITSRDETGRSINQLAEEIFSQADFSNYIIKGDIGSEKLSGFIPNGTIRSALKALLIAGRLWIDVKNGNRIEISRIDFSNIINQNEKIVQRKIVQSEIVTSINPLEGMTIEMIHIWRDEQNIPKITGKFPISFGKKTSASIRGNSLITNPNQAFDIYNHWKMFFLKNKQEISYKCIWDLDFSVGEFLSVKNEMNESHSHRLKYLKCDLLRGFLSSAEGI